MTDTVRNQKGQFVGSGNPKGRPLKFKRDPKLPAYLLSCGWNV